MSDLRFFANVMYDIIEKERQSAALLARALAYETECKKTRAAQIPFRTDRVPIDFHRANEGLCAVARILEAKPS